MLQVYDRVMLSGSIPTLIVLSGLMILLPFRVSERPVGATFPVPHPIDQRR